MKTVRGFTLIELLVAVAVLAILLSIAAPNFFRYYRTYKYNEYVMQVESTIKWARMTAMERNINVAICVQGNSLVVYDNGVSRQFQCSGNVLRRVNISENFIQVSATAGGGSFDPRGLGVQSSTITVRRTDMNACQGYTIQSLRGAIIREACQ